MSCVTKLFPSFPSKNSLCGLIAYPASASPRRHELLTSAGIEHHVYPTHIPEIRLPSESPQTFVQRLAFEKTQPIPLSGDDIALGADTIVCVDDQIFGKPVDEEDAARMLRILSGRSHLVHTGVCLRSQTRTILDIATTEVFFLPLTESAIRAYTQTGESQDKAGAYAIQGRASCFVEKINGCYHNVVGLPVSLVYRYLQNLQW